MIPVITSVKKISQLNFDMLDSNKRVSTIRKYEKRLKLYRASHEEASNLDFENGKQSKNSLVK